MKYKLNFENIRQNGDLLFESVRGSHLFGLATENSDIDTFGVFCVPDDYLFDSRRTITEMKGVVLSDKNDDAWYELEKFVSGLGKSNPNYLEAIFTPPQWIRFYNPILDPLWNMRDSFLTKACFKSFGNYAVSQIKKAKGLKKAINTDPTEVKVRKSPLEFCYVPSNQGTKKLQDWLNDKGLKQKYCGLVSLPNTHDVYGLYYDWGTHLICEYGADLKTLSNINEIWAKLLEEERTWGPGLHTQSFVSSLEEFYLSKSELEYLYQVKKIVPYGFSGIVSDTSDSNELRVASIPKGISPLITVSYNKCGYESHCSDYKRYWNWVANRNQARYELNAGFEFDSKNISTCVRLMTEAKEIAEGKGLILDRSGIDRDFLLNIKNHKVTYDEIIKYVENLQAEMEDAFSKSTIPDEPDQELLEKILVDIRRAHYSSKS